MQNGIDIAPVLDDFSLALDLELDPPLEICALEQTNICSIGDDFDDLKIMKELVATLLSCLYEDDHVDLLPQPVNHTMKWLKNEVRVLTKFVFEGWMLDFTYDADTGSFSWRGVAYDEVTKKWKPTINVSPG